MQVRAAFNNSYLWRYAVFAVAGLGFALWCLYDAKVKYPSQLEQARVYEALKKPGVGDEEQFVLWQALAAKNGWSTNRPRLANELELAIEKQYFYGGLALLVGAIGVFYFSISWRSWIEMDSRGLRSRWGKRCEFEHLVSIDKRSWDNKGIARLLFVNDGLRQKFVLDDFKFERPQVDVMIRSVEASLDDDQILNGQREPDRDAARQDDSDVEAVETDEESHASVESGSG